MNKNRYQINREPIIAQARSELARMYRGARMDDPRIARLLYKRVKAAKTIMLQDGRQRIYVAEPTLSGGLRSLVGD